MPARVSILSNSPWSQTGYGVQARLLAKRLQAAGHPTAIQAFYGLEGAMLLWEDGIPIYPRAWHPYGADVMAAHARHFRADILLSLMDAWVLDPRMLGGVPWVAWAPVDMEPMPPPVLNHLRQAYQFVAMSQFGVRMAEEAGLPVTYAPHVVETNVYTPGGRVEARERLGLPRDAFIVGIVAANKGNPSRKAWPQMLDAFARFKRHHSDAVLYCHTTKGSHGEAGGVNLPELVEYLGLRHAEQGRPNADGADVIFSDQYLGVLGLNDEHMVTLYRAVDVKLLTSMGEGFGVPLIESQSCGIPVITGAWTAMDELCFGGWRIPREDADPFWTALGAYQFLPRVGAIVEALETAYDALSSDKLRTKLSRKARAGALDYDADRVFERYWLPLLAEWEQRIRAGEPVTVGGAA